jgi:tight adherence protein C
MIGLNLLQVTLFGAFGLLILAAILLPMLRRNERIEARVKVVATTNTRDRGGVADQRPSGGNPISRLLRFLGGTVVSSGLLSKKTIDDLENTMSSSGHQNKVTLPLFVGVKVALLFGLPVLCWIVISAAGSDVHSKTVPILGSAIVGLLAPDYFIRRSRKAYLRKLENGLPDALDLLIICAEAGLALEAGFDRVAYEFAEGSPETSAELKLTASEMKILSDRRRALVNMGTRTGIEAMARLGGTLAQTIQYCTPVSQALRVLAAEMRQATLTRYEEKAAKLPVILTIPMILFILPCVFLVVGGPAVVQVMATMSNK